MSAMFPQRAPTKKKGVATTEQLLYNYYTDNNQQCSGKKEKRSSTMYIYIYNNEPGVLKTTLGCFLHMSALYLHPPKPIDFSFFFSRVFDAALAVYLVALLISYRDLFRRPNTYPLLLYTLFFLSTSNCLCFPPSRELPGSYIISGK